MAIVRRGFDAVRSRLTGIGFLSISASWNPPVAQRTVILRLFNFLENRRVLYVPSNFEIPGEVERSIIEIRHELTQVLNDLPENSWAARHVRHLRMACRHFLEDAPPDYRNIAYRLRDDFGHGPPARGHDHKARSPMPGPLLRTPENAVSARCVTAPVAPSIFQMAPGPTPGRLPNCPSMKRARAACLETDDRAVLGRVADDLEAIERGCRDVEVGNAGAGRAAAVVEGEREYLADVVGRNGELDRRIEGLTQGRATTEARQVENAQRHAVRIDNGLLQRIDPGRQHRRRQLHARETGKGDVARHQRDRQLVQQRRPAIGCRSLNGRLRTGPSGGMAALHGFSNGGTQWRYGTGLCGSASC